MEQPLLEMARAAGATIQQDGTVAQVAAYGDARAEYTALTTGAALVDGSQHGRLRLVGQDRAAFLHNFTTQDITGLPPGQATWAVVSNWKGTIVDRLEVFAEPAALRLVTEPGLATKTATWLNKYIITEAVTVHDDSADLSQLELLGPQAGSLLGRVGLPAPATEWGSVGELAGASVTVISHRWIGGEGFRLLIPTTEAATLWQILADAGAQPVGHEALTWRRVMDGYPVYGHELGETVNPWEARLQQALSLDKGCYLGQEVIARLNTYQKVQRLLVGLDLAAGAAPSVGAPVLTPAGETVGQVTTGAVPPDAPGPRALAFVKRGWSESGTRLVVGDVEATVADRPFWS